MSLSDIFIQNLPTISTVGISAIIFYASVKAEFARLNERLNSSIKPDIDALKDNDKQLFTKCNDIDKRVTTLEVLTTKTERQ